MNTPLQRLVDRARGGPQGAGLHIEPLLGAPCAAPVDVAHDLPEAEVETEAGPPARVSMASPPSAPRRVQRPAAISGRDPAGPWTDPPGTALPAPDMPQPAAESAAAGNAGQAAMPSARNRSAVAAKGVHGQEARGATDTTPRPEPALPGHAPHAPPRRAPSGSGISPAPVVAAPPQRLRLAPIESPPNITIAIGRVEVRNAPTPASAGSPHRPFRPSLSLDAFLRRGRGDG